MLADGTGVRDRFLIGSSDFVRIRQEGFCYVDKTGLIEALLSQTDLANVMLFTRPRRFGKTMALRMLEAFCDIRRDSRALFEGLEAASRPELCALWMNRYPVLFLSLKGVDGLSYAQAYEGISAVLSRLCEEHRYLLDSDRISEREKDWLRRMLAGSASGQENADCLLVLTRLLSRHYGKPVIVLLDEYDVPLARAADKGYYQEMVHFMRSFLQVFKDNDALQLGILSGCLRIARESIFTGLNNCVINTVLDRGFGEYFGFTVEEVNGLLRENGLEDRSQEVQYWYDGYRFGDTDIYCPWDVVNYIRDHREGHAGTPKCYWSNSSDNAIVRSFLDEPGAGAVRGKFEILLGGGTITEQIREDMTYDYLHAGTQADLESNFWSVLLMTGYLTRSVPGSGAEERDGAGYKIPEEDTGTESSACGFGMVSDASVSYGSESIPLRIPNREVLQIFETAVRNWFSDRMLAYDRRELFSSVWNGDTETITKELSRLLRQTISYHDYREDFYHAFLAGVFVGAGYRVESNREHGEGRSDIIVYDEEGDRAAVFEIKYSRSLQGMPDACERALEQIHDRCYAEDLTEEYANVLCYGLAFYRKRCLVKGNRSCH